MSLTRRQFASALTLSPLFPSALVAQEDEVLNAVRTTLFGTPPEFQAGMDFLRARGNPDVVPALLTGLRFTRTRRDEISWVMEALSGESYGADWFRWMLWQERNTDLIPHPSLATFKREVFLNLDRDFDLFLRPEYLARDKMKIRLEEITWGGVVKDGIPSLDNPTLIDAKDAAYMKDSDLVFGVTINGDTRAYPLRIMGWHEMFNEVIGGVPVALAYCTLCGSGILFETQVPGRSKPLVFGSSGFLYRSNKLMFDRETHSLWNQYTGKPVVGPLVDSRIELKQRPVVITEWGTWKAAHPDSKILSKDTGFHRNYASGAVYREYFASDDLMFPAQVDQRVHKQKDYVFAIREFGAARAWPLDAFEGRPVINDAIADRPLVLIGAPGERSVRAYERGSHQFTSSKGALVDETGAIWQVTEDALLGPAEQSLPRVAGHISYWFAWDNYVGDIATVYDG